jgi:MFS family permease
MASSLLRERDVRLIVGAVGISALGDFLLWVPLTLHLQETTDSGIAVAALFVALWAPIVVLAPVAGLVVDRFEARGVLLTASLFQAAIAASLALALDSTTAVLVLAALLGIGFAFAQPAEFALVPVIGGDERLTEINGFVETARYAGMTLGPLIGGVLAGLGGVDIAMVVNAGTFVVVATAALVLHARRPPHPAAADGAPDRARDGIVYLFRDRTLALVMSVLIVSLLFMTASVTAEVFFLKEDLQVADSVYGLLFAGWTAGMVIGALFVARRVPARYIALGALVATAVQGIGLGLPTAWLVVVFAGAMWFVGGLGHGTKNVLARTLVQQRVPERLHGRAFAAYNGMRNGAELFALAGGGALVGAIGGRATLALAGGVAVVAGWRSTAGRSGRSRRSSRRQRPRTSGSWPRRRHRRRRIRRAAAPARTAGAAACHAARIAAA